jgi:hypothetical protein
MKWAVEIQNTGKWESTGMKKEAHNRDRELLK